MSKAYQLVFISIFCSVCFSIAAVMAVVVIPISGFGVGWFGTKLILLLVRKPKQKEEQSVCS
jgi:hypothetical protein